MVEIQPNHIRDIPIENHSKKNNVPIYVKDHLLYTYDDITIGLVDSRSKHCPTELLGRHRKPITAMCLSLGGSRFLCSCCSETVVIWDIGSMFNDRNKGANPEKFIVGVELGPISFCALTGKWLALGQEEKILIILLQFRVKDNGEEELTEVDEYASFPLRQKTSLANFSPLHPNMLVVVDDNTFKIFDVSSQQLVHQSPGFGTHALTYSSFSGENAKLVLGTNKGQAHVYSVTDLNGFSLWNVISVDVCKALTLIEKHTNDADFGDRNSEAGCIVFSAQLYAQQKGSAEALNGETELFDNVQSANTLSSILAPGSMLIVFSNRGITIFDCKSAECLTHLHITELLPRQSVAFVEFGVLAGESLDKLTCIVKSSERGASIKIVALQCSEFNFKVSELPSSIIPKGPVEACSVLRRRMKLSPERSAYNLKAEKWCKRKTASKTSVSSCYGKPTEQKMFVPTINNPSKSSTFNQTRKSSKSNILNAQLVDMNSVQNFGPPKQNVQEVCISDTAYPIRLEPSGDGKFVACTTSPSAICVLPFKNFDLGKSVNLISHNATVNALHFNFDSKWLMSCSKDSTTKVWDWKNKKCILDIDKKKETGAKSKHQKKTSNSNPDIIDARFYYMDQFLLLASDNCLDMYCHQLNDPNIKPGSSGLFRSKLVHTMHAPSQKITCFSAANQLHSYIVLCGSSDKSVRAYDINAESFCVELADVHTRPPHRLHQVTGSACAAEMHDLFLTAALSDCVRLWDLRSTRCVQKYSRHVMRSYAAGIDVSPCARYVAVGSEDKAVYIYDTRQPEDYLGKLTVRGDVVMDVAFSPSKPLLAASTLNGFVTRFSA